MPFGLILGGAAILGGLLGGGSSGGSQTTTAGPMSPEEAHLLDLQTQLSQAQLDNVTALKPYQQQLIDQTIKGLQSQSKYQDAYDAAITPEDQAAAAAAEFKRQQANGPMQDQIQQLQLDALKQGGRATDQQKADIANATDAAIAAGTGDINTQTQRGIGMISDELANSRGLRLSDSPISGEAALLTRAGSDQAASLVKGLRASQASAVLNYPLAVQNLQSNINQNQQQLFSSAQNFQDQLRQQAYQNRLALTGTTSQTGIGLSGIGSPSASIYALNSSRGSTTDKTAGFGEILQGIGSAASGISAGAKVFGYSDRRLKDDAGVVGETSEGIPLHLYKYKGERADAPLRLGVMADEAKQIKPHAVKRHPSGYDMVDYVGIGLK